jgi:peptidoglycan-associated lipoprotein
MKKITVVLGLLAISGLTIAGCAKKETVKPEQQPSAAQAAPQPAEQPAVTAQAQQPAEKTIAEIQKELLMIHFDFNKYNIRPDAKTILEDNAKVLSVNPNVNVQIAGYCDDRGSVEYNLALGEKRAQAAKDYLVTLGVAPGRLSTISYGKSDPINPANNEKAWAENRRDEFHIAQ